MYIGQSESARFWLTILNDIQRRGVKGILIACIDSLKDFVQAIKAVFPQTKVQLCIVHQIRNSLKHVAPKENRSVQQTSSKCITVSCEKLQNQSGYLLMIKALIKLLCLVQKKIMEPFRKDSRMKSDHDTVDDYFLQTMEKPFSFDTVQGIEPLVERIWWLMRKEITHIYG